MVWTIPYTFVAGTKARANEVNENFTSLKQFVDQLEVNEANNEINITNLESNKANLNGSNTELFSAADPTSNYNVVNLQTFERLTQNSVQIITGYKLSIFDNDTITAEAGACYDSTFAHIIVSASSLQVSDSNIGANVTRYVYVCLDSDTSQTELVLSTSNTTPTLPSGYDYFRRIGSLVTDDDGNIKEVYSDTNSVTLGDVQRAQNPSAGMPNYSALVARSIDTTYNESTAGYVRAYTGQKNGASISVYVDEVEAYGCTQWKYVQGQRILVPVPEGSSWRATGSNCSVDWIPVIGV